jgi:predicted TIM-barrel fold metal-dependent hydrolase
MIIDADLHTMEPADLWSSAGLPIEGTGWNGVAVQGQKLLAPKYDFDIDPLSYHAGMGRLYKDAVADSFGPTSTVDALDREGIDTAVVIPTRALGLIAADLDALLLSKAVKVYDDYIAGFCAKTAGRCLAVGLLALHDPEAAVFQARYAKKLGLAGVVTRPNPIGGCLLNHPDREDVWSALESLDLPVILHEGTGSPCATLGLDRARTYLEAHVMSHPFEQMAAMVALIGVMSRHPGLRFGFFECGSGWLPYWCERMDDHCSGLLGREYTLPEKPSFYVKRQAFVTMEPGEHLTELAREGLEPCVLYASDYPHGDSKFPYSRRLAQQSAGAQWSQVSNDNARRFYGVFK